MAAPLGHGVGIPTWQPFSPSPSSHSSQAAACTASVLAQCGSLQPPLVQRCPCCAGRAGDSGTCRKVATTASTPCPGERDDAAWKAEREKEGVATVTCVSPPPKLSSPPPPVCRSHGGGGVSFPGACPGSRWNRSPPMAAAPHPHLPAAPCCLSSCSFFVGSKSRAACRLSFFIPLLFLYLVFFTLSLPLLYQRFIKSVFAAY